MVKKFKAEHILLVLTALGLLMIAGAGIVLFQAPVKNTGMAGVKIGGPFTLTDHAGALRTEKDLAGRYTLIYFGFTYCPAICPTELQKMNQALKRIGTLAEKVQPVFITIDPARDTQIVMAAYVPQFHPRLLGLTGTQEQIDAVLKAYRVYARRVDDPALSDYTMDHSSYIYLIDPQGLLLEAYGITSTPAEIAAGLRRHVTL